MTEPAAPYASKAETPGEDRELVDLEAAVQRTPVDAGAWLALARGYRDRGHHELSAETLQRATLLDPRSAAAWYRLSIARSRLEQSKEALAAARRAAALDSGLDETGRPEAAVWAGGAVRRGASQACLPRARSPRCARPRPDAAGAPAPAQGGGAAAGPGARARRRTPPCARA